MATRAQILHMKIMGAKRDKMNNIMKQIEEQIEYEFPKIVAKGAMQMNYILNDDYFNGKPKHVYALVSLFNAKFNPYFTATAGKYVFGEHIIAITVNEVTDMKCDLSQSS